MTKRKKKFDWDRLKKFMPYILTATATILVVALGSLDKQGSYMNLSLNAFAENNYKVSVDQLSELYVVADLSDALGLASAPDTASNYVVTNTLYKAGQVPTAGKIEKPTITNVVASRGVIEYVVSSGETMQSIADKYGISTDEIRWSNDLKTTDVSEGDLLYLPNSSGIVYTVKSDDSVASIADRYGSSVEEIIALNDLEVSGIEDGMRIFIKGGTLPETERPEYVAPAPVVQTYYYTYLGSNSQRQNMEELGSFYNLGGPYVAGQCTQWAWYMRQDLPSNLGNAATWAYNASLQGFRVDNIPAAGAVFQSSSWGVGHVGYVESVNSDGSIVATEMNYGWPYRVIRSTIPASSAAYFQYIH